MVKNTDLEIINFKSKFNFSLINFFKDIKNFAYFDSALIKKINKQHNKVICDKLEKMKKKVGNPDKINQSLIYLIEKLKQV